MAPSGKGSSVSSESEGRDFSHANDGGQGGGADSRLSAGSVVWRRKPYVDTAVRGEVVLQLARNEREKVVEE